VLTNFYDDFPAAELRSNAPGADTSIKATFALLGWTLSSDPDKSKDYRSTFTMLGVQMELDKLPQDVIQVNNKPERIAAITVQLDSIIRESLCKPVLAGEIRGKCLFAASQTFGRMALGPLHALAVHQFQSKSGIVTESLRRQILELRLILNSGVPRTMYFRGETRPIIVYTDGACEGIDRDDVTMGAVCFDMVTGKSVMMGGEVPRDLVKDWKADGKVQTIGQAELLPVLMVRLTLKGRLRHRRVFYYIDNDGARMSLIKGYSPSESSNRIINSLLHLESEEQSWSWFSRVASHSNPADGPSRLRLVPEAENLFSEPIDMIKVPRDVFSSFD
jgi:hypothetical protein